MKNTLTFFIILSTLLLNFNGILYAKTEHMYVSKKVSKKSPTDLVINNHDNLVIIESNVIEAIFTQNFSTKNACVGDRVDFLLNNGLCTKEGTRVLPEGTIIVSKITKLVKPKSFNRSGKVTLKFVCFITPDGRNIPINGKVFSNKEFLSRGKLNALGKGMATTLGAGGVGVGAGCGIGAAASAVIIGGFAIGLPVGIAIGAVAGLITPGLHYKAKAGDKILIQLTNDICIPK